MFDHIDFTIINEEGVRFTNGSFISSAAMSNLLYQPAPGSQMTDISFDDYTKHINPEKSSDYYIDGVIHLLEAFPVTDIIRSSYCRLLSFGWAQSGPRYYTKRTNAFSYLLLYTLSGDGLFEYGGERYELHAGDGFLIDCRQPHLYKTLDRQWEHIDIHLVGPMLDPVYEEYSRSRKPVFHESVNGSFMDDLEKIASLQSRKSPYKDYQMAGLLYSLFVRLLSASTPQSSGRHAVDESLQSLIVYIDSHYTEKLSLDFMSRYSGISKYYLSREFHRYTGFSPIEYLIQLRISRAEILLLRTTIPIARIAEQVGIPNIQHFSKLFRRVTGLSPRGYRSSVQ